MLKLQRKLLTLDEFTAIVKTANPRLVTRMAVNEMAVDIMENGLQTPPEVWRGVEGARPNKGESEAYLEMLRGHRRSAGILALVENHGPEIIAKIFSEFQGKIPVDIYPTTDPAEAARRKIDHGNVMALTTKHEIFMAAAILFEQGFKEAEVTTTLAGLLASQASKASKIGKELNALRAKIDAGEWQGSARVAQEAEWLRLFKEHHRGTVQDYKRLWRLPHIVRESRYFGACGTLQPDGRHTEEELADTVTNSEMRSLVSQFEIDLADVDSDGLERFNKNKPGPAFLAKWAEVRDKVKGPVGPKTMNRGDQEEYRKNHLNSKGLKALSTMVSDNNVGKYSGLVAAADRLLLIAETVSNEDAEFWQTVVSRFENIVQRRQDEAQARAEATVAEAEAEAETEAETPVETTEETPVEEVPSS